MLKWCSYCQQLMHEIAPYDDLGITHGMCGDCKPKHLDAHVEPDLTHARFVGAIQSRLAEAGWRNDLAAAEAVIATCGAANMRGVDILVGVIAPLLYQIGRDWELGLITVADEHRFTRFCEDVFTIIVRTRGASLVHAEGEPGQRVDTLLMNAPGNSHTLAMRMLVLWLADKGMAARVLTRSGHPSRQRPPEAAPDLAGLGRAGRGRGRNYRRPRSLARPESPADHRRGPCREARAGRADPRRGASRRYQFSDLKRPAPRRRP
jgi:hypothetical protein